MFQSNLEFSNKTPAGCAVIKIPAPAGEGEIEFEISRVGSSDNVLGNNGWQPSEHWFLIEGENIAEGIEVLIILEKNIVLNLGNLNYKITVRRVGQRSSIEGVLRGGLRQSPNLSSNIKKIQDRSKLENVTSVKIDKSTSSENAKIILELDKLPNFEEKSLNNPDEKNNGLDDNDKDNELEWPFPKGFNDVNESLIHSIADEEKIKNENSLEVAHNLSPKSENLVREIVNTTNISNDSKLAGNITQNIQNAKTHEHDQNKILPSTEKKNNKFILAFFGLFVVLGAFYFVFNPDKNTPPLVSNPPETVTLSDNNYPEPSTQEANKIIYELSDMDRVYAIGMSWKGKGHDAEAYLLFEKAAQMAHPKSTLALAELFDPSLRDTVKVTFPNESAISAATWYLKSYQLNVDVNKDINRLRDYLRSNNSLNQSEKDEAIKILSQIH